MWWVGQSPNHYMYSSLLRARGLFITLLAPTPAPTAIRPTETPKPAEATPTASAITEATVAEVQLEASENLAIRRGPGLAYNIVGTLTPDQRVRVLGRNADGGWAYVEQFGGTGLSRSRHK